MQISIKCFRTNISIRFYIPVLTFLEDYVQKKNKKGIFFINIYVHYVHLLIANTVIFVSTKYSLIMKVTK